jgi:hypothetical protein
VRSGYDGLTHLSCAKTHGSANDRNIRFSKDKVEDRALLRNAIVHAGDLANPTKPTALMTKWTAGVRVAWQRHRVLFVVVHILSNVVVAWRTAKQRTR